MKQTIILGNIITMDEKRPFAKAAVVKNGVFAYIGGAEEAKKLAGADAKVMDYGDNFIYPGFIEAHAHGVFAGYRAIGQANLAQGRSSLPRILNAKSIWQLGGYPMMNLSRKHTLTRSVPISLLS